MIDIKKLEGRNHYVVPVVMIVEGVLNGSDGPIRYSAEVLRNSVSQWNAKPVIVYHPELYGQSAADNPIVFDKQKVGVIFHTKFEGGRLTAEAWLDVERLNAVDTRVAQSIKKGQPVEVSTGVYIDQNEKGEALALGPDHLAILPTGVGACSLKDGCGLMVNIEVQALPLPTMG